MLSNNRTRITPKPIKNICFCASLKPLLFCNKIAGFFPLFSYHENDLCVFKISWIWICLSVLMVLILLFHLCFDTEIFNLFNISVKKSLHVILSGIISIVYSLYVILLVILNIFKTPQYVKTLNKLSVLLREGLLCQSALKNILHLQYVLIFQAALAIAIQLSALVYLQFSENYETNFDHKIYLNELIHNITFFFYIQFISICFIFMRIFGCYEQIALNVLNFIPVLSQSSTEIKFTYIFKNKFCSENHVGDIMIKRKKIFEIIEYLRCLHEKIAVLIYDVNKCLNPQLLFHIVVELTVLIVNYYAVVIYFMYDFDTPVSSTINFLNCLFVTLHTNGIYMFLRSSQRLQDVKKSFLNILLEYSTNINGADEHQQVRLFIEKLNQYQPLNASGIVNINLSIAGPICAHILTYVLVALQFNVSKK